MNLLRRIGRVAVTIVGAAALALLTGFKDGPVPHVAGGFGDGTCHACHQDFPPNAAGGALSIEGIPQRYRANRSYQISIAVARPGMLSGGFALTARFAAGPQNGRQAGAWRIADARAQTAAEDDEVRFVTHTELGAAVSEGKAAWTITWIAPPHSAWPVQFNIAANAANDDASPLGDYIYAAERRSEARFPAPHTRD